ncbi:MFS transporter [Oerskovia sp. M15]
MSVLAASQVLGGIGVATGISVSSLIASELSGSDAIAGLAQTTAVVGAALVALPLSRLAERHGRRRSLTTGYVVALLGALLAATATLLQTWPLLLAGMLLFGAGPRRASPHASPRPTSLGPNAGPPTSRS